MNELTQKRLKELFIYDPYTGIFTRKVDCNRAKRGDRAECKHNQGYVRISVDGNRYLAHRLAFLYMTGTLPSQEVDHINGTRSDNSWNNLRECSSQQNKFNMAGYGKSGVKGVYWNTDKRKWQAQTSVNGRVRYLGRFDDLEVAEELVKFVREIAHGEFAR